MTDRFTQSIVSIIVNSGYLGEVLGLNNGIVKKIAQYLSVKDDQTSIFLERPTEILNSVPPEILDVITKINTVNYCGSIGIIYTGVDPDNRKLAIKYISPKIRSVIKKQFSLLKIAPNLKLGNDKVFDIKSFIGDVESTFNHELDLELEISQFPKFDELDGVHLPKVYPDLSSSSLLVMDCIDGKNIAEVMASKNLLPLYFGEKIMQSYLNQLFKKGIAQGDNNPGNYLIESHTNNIFMVDLGNCIEISLNARRAIYSIVKALRIKKNIDFVKALGELGYNTNTLRSFSGQLQTILEIIFFPFLENKIFNAKSWSPSKLLRSYLGDNAFLFRTSGNFFSFNLSRSYGSLIQLLQFSESELNFYQIFNRACSDSLSILETDLFDSNDGIPSPPVLDGNIQIQLTENDEEIVNLTFPANILFNIEDFLPQEALNEIEDPEKLSGILLQKITNASEENSHLYTYSNKGRTLKITYSKS